MTSIGQLVIIWSVVLFKVANQLNVINQTSNISHITDNFTNEVKTDHCYVMSSCGQFC